MNFKETILMDSTGRMVQIPFPWAEVMKYLEGKQELDSMVEAVENELEKTVYNFYKDIEDGVLYLIPAVEKPIKLIFEEGGQDYEN